MTNKIITLGAWQDFPITGWKHRQSPPDKTLGPNQLAWCRKFIPNFAKHESAPNQQELSMTDMVLVPCEPTEAMLRAGDSAIPRAEEPDNGARRMMGREVCLEAWRAMLAAAPPPQLPDELRHDPENGWRFKPGLLWPENGWRFKPGLLWPENGWRWQRPRRSLISNKKKDTTP